MENNPTTSLQIVQKRPRGRPRKYAETAETKITHYQNSKRGRGRPKGSISNHTRKGIATREAFAKLVEQNIQPIFNSLYERAMLGDITALNTLLDRAWGRPVQGIDLNANVKIDLVQLALEASKLYENKDGVYVEKQAS